MANLFANYATGRLLNAIDAVATTITLEAGQGARFPEITGGDSFQIVVEDVNGNWEICKVTTHAAAADSMVVTRAQEGSTAKSFVVGSAVELRLTKTALDAFLQKTGGTMSGPLNMGGQQITNAVLTSPTLNTPTLNTPTLNTPMLNAPTLRSSAGVATNQIAFSGTTPQIGGNTIWHAGNDGSGSGLDADLLDGTHLSALVQTSRSVLAGNGLTGGGTLAADRTLTLGTPATLTKATSNGVTASSHTHAIGDGIVKSHVSTGGQITVSTGVPSGGANGDIHFRV